MPRIRITEGSGVEVWLCNAAGERQRELGGLRDKGKLDWTATLKSCQIVQDKPGQPALEIDLIPE